MCNIIHCYILILLFEYSIQFPILKNILLLIMFILLHVASLLYASINN